MLKVRYFDRENNKQVVIIIQADVLTVEVPAVEFPEFSTTQPPLTVNVNTDAVIVDLKENGRRVAMFEFSDLLADMAGEA